jgi:hypothetical protein
MLMTIAFSEVENKLNEESFFSWVKTNSLDVLVFDNITTSQFYMDQKISQQSNFARKIKSITKQHFHGTVHNIGVKNDESYCVENIKVKNCRGVWVPIFKSEEQPKANPIPKSIIDSFDKIGDKPQINGFKQLKKPINTKQSVDAKAEIAKRLK